MCILVRFRQRTVREAVEAGFAVPARIATEQRMMHVQICRQHCPVLNMVGLYESLTQHDADLFLYYNLNKERCNNTSPEWGSQGATPDSGIGRSIE